jgi:protein-S-isoprenylcysteine O-methyltransferase Ste14
MSEDGDELARSEAPTTEEITPEGDLLDRYERMVQTQVETVNGIDDKAATTMRVVAVLLGVLLSLLTFFVDGSGVEITVDTVVPVLWVATGVAGLLASLAGCLYTYLSSRTLFGPNAELGDVLSLNRVTLDDYRTHLLGGYAKAIRTNREVIRTNSRRFRNTLLLMIYGLVGVSTGLSLFITNISVPMDIVVTVGVLLVVGAFSVYILQERYMVLQHEE